MKRSSQTENRFHKKHNLDFTTPLRMTHYNHMYLLRYYDI